MKKANDVFRVKDGKRSEGHDLHFYIIMVSVIICTIVGFSLAMAFQVNNIFRDFFTLPGIIGLIGIIFEAWRDKRAHDRNLDLQTRQQDNALAITSHMASVVFDRQVDFCEAYFEKAYDALSELFKNGPSERALDYAQELYHIRTRYSPWFSSEIEAGLLPFEKALRECGSAAMIIKMNLPQPDHQLFVTRMYDAFGRLSQIPIIEHPKEISPEEATYSIVDQLRNVLGVSQLTSLRDQALNLAISRSKTLLN